LKNSRVARAEKARASQEVMRFEKEPRGAGREGARQP
jgi:hypothetical protein